MASTNKTTTLELSQFVGTDVPGWLTDYNSDMSKIDAFAAEANSDISGAVQSANSANTTAQAASTAANQAVSTAQNALNTANNAINIPNHWKTVNPANPNSEKFTVYNAKIKYNKLLGIAFITINISANAGAFKYGDVLANIGADFAPSSDVSLQAFGIGLTGGAEGKMYSYTFKFNTAGQLVIDTSPTSDTANIRICNTIVLAGSGNGWAQST